MRFQAGRSIVRIFFYAIIAGVSTAAASAAEPITIVVDSSATPITSIVHVHETVPVDASDVELAYPRWVPGEHGPVGPISDITGLVVTAGTQTLPWQRDGSDLNEFHITVPPGASKIDVAFDFLGTNEGTYSEARLATKSILTINWNQYLLYPQTGDIAKVMVEPTLVLPGADWQIGTALPGPVRAGARVTFAPATLERLVDSPLDAGTAYRKFTFLDADGFTNELDAFADRSDELDLPPATEKKYAAMVGEMDAIYGARHWKNYHFLLTLSDVMAGNGVEHGSSSDDGTDGDGLIDADNAILTAGLLAHEFNHSWDGKYRRPAELATTNFQVPEQTDLLWIYEGMTQLYGEVVPVRAGIDTVERFRDQLALTYANLDHEPGRLVRPLADTAVSAPFLYSAPRALAGERRTAGDFYNEGALLWLDVDADLRTESHGAKSLDGFCRTFFGIANTPPMVNPYTYEQFLAALDAYAPRDWRAYFATRVYAPTQHPPAPFAKLGWKETYDDKPNALAALLAKNRKRLVLPPGIGFAASTTGVISDVATGSAADTAGLGFGDTIVAVNAHEFDAEALDRAIKEAKTSPSPIALIVKRDGLFRTVALSYHGGLAYPHLTRIPGTPDVLTTILSSHGGAK